MPFISYFIIFSGRYWPIIWIVSASLAFLNQVYFNVFNVQPRDFTLEMSYKLATWLSMFLSGSFMTIIYYKLEKSEIFKKIKVDWIQNLVSLLTLFMFFYGLRIFSSCWGHLNSEILENNKNIISGFYWSIFVFLMLIGSPNFLTNIFATNKVLKSFGKYSFGIYLLHPMFIRLVDENYFPVTDIERILMVIALSFVSGVVFFHTIEEFLTNIANRLCKFIDNNLDKKINLI